MPNRTQLGDPISLTPEKDDSVPLSSVPDFSADPYRNNESLPHSKKVRGKLGNQDGPKVNKSMLGDPVSFKAETSKTDADMGAGPARDVGDLKRAAEIRGELQGRSRSKL